MKNLQSLLEWIEKYEAVNGTPTMSEIKAQINMLLLEQVGVNKSAIGGVSVELCPYCGTDTLIKLSDGTYCTNDCCAFYRAN